MPSPEFMEKSILNMRLDSFRQIGELIEGRCFELKAEKESMLIVEAGPPRWVAKPTAHPGASPLHEGLPVGI